MLNKGYIFKNIVYISTSHNNKILKKYLKDFEKTILQLKKYTLKQYDKKIIKLFER